MNSRGLKYRCFLSLYYLLPAVTDHFLYASLIASPSKGLFLDLGGGQATDARKLIQDGWPADKIVVSDLTPFLWDVGLDLFQDGPTGPVTFKQANILNAADTEPGGALHSYIGKAGDFYLHSGQSACSNNGLLQGPLTHEAAQNFGPAISPVDHVNIIAHELHQQSHVGRGMPMHEEGQGPILGIWGRIHGTAASFRN